jgi:hypothetical protein
MGRSGIRSQVGFPGLSGASGPALGAAFPARAVGTPDWTAGKPDLAHK